MNHASTSSFLKLPKPLVLASSSPRRAQLLQMINLPFTVCPSSIAENGVAHLAPEEQAVDLAKRKAQAVASVFTWGIVVGADTVVEMGGQVFGKPADEDEARAMLRQLSGKTHNVYTGIAIRDCPTGRTVSDFSQTSVSFRELDEEEISAYVATGSPMDKAGAYGIQDLSAIFAEKIDGCFYNVMGFPLAKFYLMLRDFFAKPETSLQSSSTEEFAKSAR